jgi:hypothetical protein
MIFVPQIINICLLSLSEFAYIPARIGHCPDVRGQASPKAESDQRRDKLATSIWKHGALSEIVACYLFHDRCCLTKEVGGSHDVGDYKDQFLV